MARKFSFSGVGKDTLAFLEERVKLMTDGKAGVRATFSDKDPETGILQVFGPDDFRVSNVVSIIHVEDRLRPHFKDLWD